MKKMAAAKITLHLLFVALLLLSASSKLEDISELVAVPTKCPCKEERLCEPLKVPNHPQLFGFMTSSSNYKNYNYTYLTSVAVFGELEPEMVCTFHENKVRLILVADAFDLTMISDSDYRDKWALQQVERVISNFADGLNIDFEKALPIYSKNNSYFVDLVSDLNSYLKKVLPNALLSIDVPYSPPCTYGRCYDYYQLGKHIDFLIIMAYDEQGVGLGPCIAKANSPFLQTMQGILGYIQSGVPAFNIILAVPWYGYDFTCTKVNEMGECELDCASFEDPLQNCPNIWNGIETQVAYKDIVPGLLNMSNTGREWNTTMKSPFFNYVSKEGAVHQVWYDDPESLGYKYYYAAKSLIGGVGVWHLDCLDYVHDLNYTHEMWSTFDLFFGNL